MVDVTHAEFEALVSLALDAIPDALADRMDNVAVVVEDMGASPNLLGLYHGVPLTARGNNYGGMVLPDRISIYRLPICRISRDNDHVVEQVRRTVIHEVAHHFGISDERLTELGWN
jgi:predicted Zn-dependent protease with MMP-like domain